VGRKGHNKDHDLSEIQALKQENRILRKHISSLRKQISRVDLSENEGLKVLIEKHEEQEEKQAKRKEKDKHLMKWACECGRDFLYLVILNRADGQVYFRRCPACSKKTKLQKYKDTVEGLIESDVTDQDRDRLLK
jgi:hypothetical protein